MTQIASLKMVDEYDPGAGANKYSIKVETPDGSIAFPIAPGGVIPKGFIYSTYTPKIPPVPYETKMHTTKVGDTTFIHNGGFEGEVTISREMAGGTTPVEMVVPFAALIGLVAEAVRREKIQNLQDMSDMAVLFGGDKL